MAPTESAILHNYLTSPAQLPSAITLEEFTELFPKSHRTNPQIRSLYRDLQHQRRAIVDTVTENITAEEKRGRAIKSEIARARIRATAEDADLELEIERALFGSMGAQNAKHTLNSIVPEMDMAIADLEAEIQKLEAQEATLLDSIKQTVGTMSDLRYGRLSNPKLKEDVIQGLKSVQEACDGKS
ncbi:Cnl2/NKP2 family protein [Colletotrichum sublineola]|uniref:Putative Cnl2/NKP2 family protein n=1 Tax=Colletotrichum sublineola TaxID=1173701 RepID=A0A066XI75_COLSU|nr:Cnl2/NKP2 family protein [Colletotrichum sublineola]KDN67364.1 putative Cnl2/NKP2 family protein [Colletotrichum sublineola]